MNALEELRIKKDTAIEAKSLIEEFAAWYYFIHWLSAPTYLAVKKGVGNYDIGLSQQHSSEFAIFYNDKDHNDTFILFAQGELYHCLTNMSISCALIENDGIVIFLKGIDDPKLYLSPLSFKIFTSKDLSQKLNMARNFCKKLKIAKLEAKQDIYDISWSILELMQKDIPVITHSREIPNL